MPKPAKPRGKSQPSLPRRLDDFALTRSLAAVGRLNAAGNHNGAARAAQAILESHHDQPDALYELGVAALMRGHHESAARAFGRALNQRPRWIEALVNLASSLREAGNLSAALDVIESGLTIDPKFASLHNNRANILVAMNRRDEAIQSYRRVLELNPNHEGAAYTLKALTGDTPGAAPPRFVARMFDQYAARFEEHLGKTLNYRTPGLLAAMLPDRCGTVLDLGCGTGLMGLALADRADAIDGVDLSPLMIEQSAAKGIYRALRVEEVGAYLSAAARAGKIYDTVLAADVFVYLGNLDTIFRDVAALLPPEGRFGLSVETSTTGDFVLQPTGRYSHAERYIRQLSEGAGLEVERLDQATLREEIGLPVVGQLALLKKR